MEGEEQQANQQYPFAMPAVLNVIEQEWSKFERDRTYWQLEKEELHAKLAQLTEDSCKQQGLKRDLIRRIKMLEAAILEQRTLSNKLIGGDSSGHLTGLHERTHEHRDREDKQQQGGDDCLLPNLHTPISGYINESRMVLLHALKTLGIQDDVVRNTLRVGVNPITHSHSQPHAVHAHPHTATHTHPSHPQPPAHAYAHPPTASSDQQLQEPTHPQSVGVSESDSGAGVSSSGDELDLGELADLSSLATFQQDGMGGVGGVGGELGSSDGGDESRNGNMRGRDDDNDQECDDDEDDDDDDLFYNDLNSELVELDRNLKVKSLETSENQSQSQVMF